MHLFVENNFIRNLFLVNIVLVIIIIEQVSWLLYIGFSLSVPPSGSRTTTTRPSTFAVASRSIMSLHNFARWRGAGLHEEASARPRLVFETRAVSDAIDLLGNYSSYIRPRPSLIHQQACKERDPHSPPAHPRARFLIIDLQRIPENRMGTS